MSDEPKIRISGVEYEIPTLTLGEQRAVKRVSGMVWAELLPALESGDPDAVVGFLFAVMKRQYPERSEASLIEQVERLTSDDFEDVADDSPPAEGVASGTSSPSPETTPDPSGTQLSALRAVSGQAT